MIVLLKYQCKSEWLRWVKRMLEFLQKQKWISLGVVLFGLLLISTALKHLEKEASNQFRPQVEAGVLDLTNWNFEQDGAVKLEGKWEFYWQQLLTPDDFKTGIIPLSKSYLKAPAYWNQQKIGKKKLPMKGYATYRLVIKTKPQQGLMALKMLAVSSAYKIWLNEKSFLEVGKVGTNRQMMKPMFKAGSYSFVANTETIELIVQVSNYVQYNSGLWTEIYLGTEAQIREMRDRSLGFDLLIFGALLLMGFYHLSFFLLRRKEKMMLYFGIACFLLGIHQITVNELFLTEVFPEISWEMFVKISGCALIGSIPAFILFFQALFPKEISKKIVLLSVGVSGVFLLNCCLGDTFNYTKDRVYFMFGILALIIYTLVALVRACFHKRDGAYLSLIGFLFFGSTVINDILFSLRIIYTGNLAAVGLLFYMFFQAFLISKIISKTFNQVEALSERAFALGNLKDEFLTNISSQLSIPLNGIIGIAETLSDGVAGAITKEQAYNLALIVQSGKRLNKLVENMFDFSQLKICDLNLEKKAVDLYQIAEIVIVLLRALIEEKSLEIYNKIDRDLPLVEADENRLQQILYNLISNAIKYTETGSVTLMAFLKEPFVIVNVIDTGIGIAPERLPELFKPFRESREMKFQKQVGTGLGLSITKSLVELHGGKIWAKSTLEKGSCFSFTVSINQQEKVKQKAETASLSEAVNQKNEAELTTEQTLINFSNPMFKILVVDDELINRQLLINQLSLQHYAVTTASNGEMALKISNEQEFDLVILDAMMPKMSGYEVCKILRKKYSLSELPILMLIAQEQDRGIVIGFEAGANDYLTKPFDKLEMLARVNTLLNLKSSFKFSLTNACHLEAEWTGRILAEKMNDFTQSLASTLDLASLAGLIVKNIDSIAPFDAAVVLLCENETFYLGASAGLTNQEGLGVDLEFIKEVMHYKEPLTIEDLSEMSYQSWLEGAKSCLGLPVIFNNEVSAIIILYHKNRGLYDNYTAKMSSSFVNQTGMAIENAKLFAKVKRMAIIDVLTQVYNRRYFYEGGELEVERSINGQLQMSLLMFDIDHFKKINDTYGHSFGDEVLKGVAKRCMNLIRNADLMGRYGGEEFVILLPETDLSEALIMGEIIRVGIAEEPFRHLEEQVTVTISIGAALLDLANNENLHKLINRADVALYEAKHSGRNRVVAALEEIKI